VYKSQKLVYILLTFSRARVTGVQIFGSKDQACIFLRAIALLAGTAESAY